MPTPTHRIRFVAAILAAISASLAGAAEEESSLAGPRFSAELGVGIEYDNNIAVEEVDRATNESDYALILSAGLGVRQDLSDTIEVGATYDYNQNIYKEFSQVDRQTHILGTSLNLALTKVDTGISLFYINSRLDGEPFLQLYRASPSISGFLAKKWFARGAYVYSDKRIENRPGRDAVANAVEADAYYFRRGLRSYFNLGYRFRNEDANKDRYDYDSHSVKLRYIHRLELFSRIAKLELAWRYEDRAYSSITPSIAEKRDDKRHRWRLDFEVPVLADSSAVQFYYGYADYDSNLPSADYDQTIIGTRFVYRW
ncbi:MAG: surface lipoprotein assembly modifier [Halioglobus sp.]|nr:surface lipoprotein assembly modifier [Halioglobus sp.]